MFPLPRAKDEIGRLGVSLQKTRELPRRKSRGLKLAVASARLVLWALDVASGHLRYEFTDSTERYPTTISEWSAALDAHPICYCSIPGCRTWKTQRTLVNSTSAC
jgi:hypothetical protein